MSDRSLHLHRYGGGGSCAAAPVVWLETLGLWGGIDARTGVIVDPLHPRRGLCLHRAICIVGRTQGSTAGPGAVIEWICGEQPPAALLTRQPNLSLAVAAEALALISAAPVVLGELVAPPPVSLLTAWDGVIARLENDRITGCA